MKNKSHYSRRYSLKRIMAVIVAAGAISIALVLLGDLSGFSYHSGFLGTRGRIFSDIALISQIILVGLLAREYYLEIRSRQAARPKNQTNWILGNILLTILTTILGFSRAELPNYLGVLNGSFVVNKTIHATLGFLAVLSGIYLIMRMNHWLPSHWYGYSSKSLMRLSLGLFLIFCLLGMMNYFNLNVR